jgi:hypothetical protein
MTNPLSQREGIMRTRKLSRSALVACSVLALGGLAACGTEDSGDDDTGGTAAETAETPAAAVAGADWLEGQLEEGVLYNEQYQSNDYSTTVELAYALDAVDPELFAGEDIAAISAALEGGVEEYAMPGKEVYAGSLAKLTSFATDTGADPADFGGVDVIAALEERTADSGPVTGRISDVSQYGDFANAFGQAWAVRGLTNAGSQEAAAARDFLLLQQCEAGFFRLDFSDPKAKDQSCDGADEQVPPVDTAALAVVLLRDLADSDPDLGDALDRAVAWIVTQQAEDGSFEGGSGVAGANANSTGLAGWALHLAGEEEAAAAAAEWVRAHQVEGCSGALADAEGAIAFDDATLQAAATKGITVKTAYQWRLATAQSVPALLATPDGAEAAPCPTG